MARVLTWTTTELELRGVPRDHEVAFSVKARRGAERCSWRRRSVTERLL